MQEFQLLVYIILYFIDTPSLKKKNGNYHIHIKEKLQVFGFYAQPKI